MTEIELHEPVVGAHSCTFSWTIRPASPLYRANAFTLHFPAEVDLAQIPRSLWWTVFITCLHAHWLLLRPCTVRLPVTLPEGHAALWQRMFQASIDTMAANYNGPAIEGDVRLIESGPPLPAPEVFPDTGRCGTSFSGGKDSLTQTGILCEFTQKPLLVATTSRMAGKEDHFTARRRQVFAKIQARKEVEFIEVTSDLRSILDNDFSSARGYRFAINEVSDTYLYASSLIIAGAARGATHLFMASEAEVQENSERDGKIIQHKHFMYAVPMQSGLDALIRPCGLRFGSLTQAMHNYPQVQSLLWTRYRDICDLQYSCWRLSADETACSKCELCFNAALCALYNGGNPARMGIDLVKLFNAKKDWAPRRSAPSTAAGATPFPQHSLAPVGDAQLEHFIQHIPLRRVMALVAGRRPQLPMPAEMRSALKAYAGLRKRARAFPVRPLIGYRAGFLQNIDPLLREKVTALCASHFQPEPESDYLPVLQRSNALTAWICGPLK